MKNDESKNELILNSVAAILSLIDTISSARCRSSIDIVLLSRDILINLIGNYVFANTNYKEQGALERNWHETMEDLQLWFENMKKINRGKH